MFKKIIALMLLFLITGCVSASVKMNFNRDDTGKVIYKIAYEEKYVIEDTFNKYDQLTSDFTVKKTEYEKSGKSYIGREISFQFKDLEDFNRKFSENLSNDGTNEKIVATRKKGIVTINADANKKMYDSYVSDLKLIDYKVIISIDGKIIKTNATKINENTMEWELDTILKEGLVLKYDTSANIMLMIPIVTTFILLVIIYLINKKK